MKSSRFALSLGGLEQTLSPSEANPLADSGCAQGPRLAGSHQGGLSSFGRRAFWPCALWLTGLAGCSDAGGGPGDDQRAELPAFPSSGGSSGTPGVNNPGSAANPNTPVSNGQAGASASPGSAGSSNTGSGGSEGNVNVGSVSPGGTNPGSGAAGSGGNSPPPANPPPANPPPAAGNGFTSVNVTGGASAKFVCPTGVTFGNPLTGMGAVQQVTAPQGGFFAFIEGAMWVGSVGKVFFSDNASQPQERIWQVTPPSTTASIFMESSGSNGLAVDSNDQLLLADQRNKRITRVSTANAQVAGVVVPAGNYTPNDLIMRSDGNIYFTDPNSAGRGFYRASPTGVVSGPFSGSNAPNSPNNPNGIELSPDENTLYVGDVNARFVAKLTLNADGSIDTASGQRFVSTTGDTVDGMAVDCAGNLYVGTRTGVEVYSSAGAFVGNVPVGESSNATFGGADRKTLFVTSRSVLKFVTLAVPGLPD
jgi:gluconolactonase